VRDFFIRCSCGDDHAVTWSPAFTPTIVCPLAPRGSMTLVDTEYLGGGSAFPYYKGQLWIQGPA
jgi:hypothetical protein